MEKKNKKKETKVKKEVKKKDTKPKVKKEKKPRKKIGHKFLIILLTLGILGLGAALTFMLYIIITAPDFDSDQLYKNDSTTLLDINGNEYARLGVQNRDNVKYDELPQVLVDAIVATEDSRFFQHNGFDIGRFIKASIGQLGGNSGAGGASTLTMQIVKNTYTSTETSIIRKFTDIYMAIFKIEKKYTKEEIIEFYVNQPWLGSGAYGVEQASLTYFGKSVKDLSLPEAALIAGIFNAPGIQSPFVSLENAEARRNTVLDLMYRHNYITKEQLDDAKAISVESLIVDKKGRSLNKYQSFIDTVVQEIEDKYDVNAYITPLEIQTTLDPSIQDVLNDLNEGKLYNWVNDIVQIGIVVTDIKTGAIIGVDGGRNQTTERAFNRGTSPSMNRQPGSTAKPIFDYAPIIEYNNASTGTYFFDDPMTYSNGTSVANADRSYQGIETMRTALSASRNIPAIQAFQQVDKAKIKSFVDSVGLQNSYGADVYEASAIGGGLEVNPKEMAAAYAVFARGGYYIEPYSYTKITFKGTNDVIEHKVKREKVMSEETAYMITSILLTAQSQYAGGNFTISGTDVAAKTGTSTYDAAALKQHNVPASASADNWNITYSPDYCISLWYGYDELMNPPYYTDSNVAAGHRKRIMAAIAKKIYKTNSKFEKPSGVVSVEVEKETVPLALPSAYTPQNMRITELFKKGTEPSEQSFRYQQLDKPTNGKGSISGNTITISWNAIDNPEAIDTNKLQSYFNDNYGQFATKYYNRRLEYNNNNIGFLGYQIYLRNGNGETPIGYVTNTSYSYDTKGVNGTYTFVIRSAYSIFKDNMSEGLEISVKNTNGSASNSTDVKSAKLKGSETVNLKVSDSDFPYNDDGVIAYDSDNIDITKNIKVTKEYINKKTGQNIDAIYLSEEGEYQIIYTVGNYKDKLTRNVIVKK